MTGHTDGQTTTMIRTDRGRRRNGLDNGADVRTEHEQDDGTDDRTDKRAEDDDDDGTDDGADGRTEADEDWTD